MSKVTWRHVTLDTRTRDMCVEVAKRTTPYIKPTQGGFTTAVSASAGTHARAAIDIDTRGLTTSAKNQIVRVMREVGFAAWLRLTSEGPWIEHIHAIPIGGDISPAAQRQVDAYRRGRNGLANNGPDRHASMNVPVRTWEQYQGIGTKVTYEKYRKGITPGSRTVKLRSAGDDVKSLQRFIGSSKVGPIDGLFGPQTEKGVKWYQGMRGIVVDGIAGPQTWGEILRG